MIRLEMEAEQNAEDGAGTPTGEVEAWRAMELSRAGMSRFFNVAKKAVGLHGDVDVLLTGDRTLRRLNRGFRGKNKATDVLSFPSVEEMAGVHAGDLAVSLETARRQAEEHGHTLRDEVRVLMLHGLLHLSGMDHEIDGGEMAEREGALRRELRLPGGLIERVEGGGAKRLASMNDRKNSNNKSKRRFPSGMTKRASGVTKEASGMTKRASGVTKEEARPAGTKAGRKGTAGARTWTRGAR